MRARFWQFVWRLVMRPRPTNDTMVGAYDHIDWR